MPFYNSGYLIRTNSIYSPTVSNNQTGGPKCKRKFFIYDWHALLNLWMSFSLQCNLVLIWNTHVATIVFMQTKLHESWRCLTSESHAHSWTFQKYSTTHENVKKNHFGIFYNLLLFLLLSNWSYQSILIATYPCCILKYAKTHVCKLIFLVQFLVKRESLTLRMNEVPYLH